MKKMLSVVIPFLNEEENIPALYAALVEALGDGAEELEMVFVDDGSTDGGPAWLLQKHAEDPRIRLIQLSRNFGHQVAISAGIDLAKGDAVAIMDADMQDPPAVVRDMLVKWREGYEVVYAVRTHREGEGFAKKLFAAAFYRIFHWASSIEVPVDSGDFRLLDRKVVEALKRCREKHRYMRAMTSWVGFKQVSVAYERQARHAGETKYPVWKSARLAWDGLTSFSGAPLRWMSGGGFVVCGLGVLLVLRIIIGKWTNPDQQVPGWASLMATVLIVGGIQLISLGLVGQYLSRTFEETKKRPLYFVSSDTVESDDL